MHAEDVNDLVPILAHLTRLSLRHDKQADAYGVADILFAMCGVTSEMAVRNVIAKAKPHFDALESVQ